MKRMLLAIGGAALMLAVGAPSAHADFHSTAAACTQQVGSANVGLAMVDPTTFRYTGDVTCKGAQSVVLKTLTISALTPGATTNGGAAGLPITCTFPCDATLSATADAPAAVGVVEVKMTFEATGPTKTYKPTRVARYAYSGDGAPVLLCRTGPNTTVACV